VSAGEYDRTSMAILIFQHTSTDHSGRLAQTLLALGKKLDIRRLDLPAEALGGRPGGSYFPDDFDAIEGVISLGGAMNVGDPLPWMDAELEFIRRVHERALPLVGICLGAQLIAKALGGEVGQMESGPEVGMLPIRQHAVANTEIMLAGIPWKTMQFHAHGHEVKTPPPGAMVLQFSDRCKVQSFRCGLRTYGFQYHFECDRAMIESFLGDDDGFCAKAGIDRAAAIGAAREHYETYERVSQRLCDNIASYLIS